MWVNVPCGISDALQTSIQGKGVRVESLRLAAVLSGNMEGGDVKTMLCIFVVVCKYI